MEEKNIKHEIEVEEITEDDKLTIEEIYEKYDKDTLYMMVTRVGQLLVTEYQNIKALMDENGDKYKILIRRLGEVEEELKANKIELESQKALKESLQKAMDSANNEVVTAAIQPQIDTAIEKIEQCVNKCNEIANEFEMIKHDTDVMIQLNARYQIMGDTLLNFGHIHGFLLKEEEVEGEEVAPK